MTAAAQGSEAPAPIPGDWRGGVWVGLDLETTGTTEADRICEIGLVLMCRGKVIDAWSSLINPGLPIPSDVVAVHGITDAMVEDAPRIGDVRAQIEAFLARAVVVVGYNIYGFDQSVIERELPGILGTLPIIDPLALVRDDRVGGRWPSNYQPEQQCPMLIEHERRWLDSEGQRRKSHGRHTLTNVVEMLGCNQPERGFEAKLHRAAWDALLALRVLWVLFRWCTHDPVAEEALLRAESARFAAKMDAFRAKMRLRDAGKAKAVRDRRSEELRELATMLVGDVAGELGERLKAIEESVAAPRTPEIPDGYVYISLDGVSEIRPIAPSAAIGNELVSELGSRLERLERLVAKLVEQGQRVI